MPPLASVNNSGMSKGGMQTGGRFVVRSRTPPELERVSFFFHFFMQSSDLQSQLFVVISVRNLCMYTFRPGYFTDGFVNNAPQN